MPITPQALANRLREEGDRVTEFFNHLTRDQWRVHIYPLESDWSLHHLLAHFVSSEIGRNELIFDVQHGGKGAPIDFEIDHFNRMEVEKYSAESDDELLFRYAQERAHLVEHVSAMSMQDLHRIGNDPYLGEVPLSDMIKLTYRHLQIHLRDARRVL